MPQTNSPRFQNKANLGPAAFDVITVDNVDPDYRSDCDEQYRNDKVMNDESPKKKPSLSYNPKVDNSDVRSSTSSR